MSVALFRQKAKELGYSDEEIEAYIQSKTTTSVAPPQTIQSTVEPQNESMSGFGFVEGTPDEYKPLIAEAAKQFDIPTNILSALLKQESGFNPQAVSPVGAQGIAQFMPETAKQYGIDPLDPVQAIPAAARYIRQGLDQFGNMEMALASYNAGAGAVQKFGGIPPYPETQNYVSSIMGMSGGVKPEAQTDIQSIPNAVSPFNREVEQTQSFNNYNPEMGYYNNLHKGEDYGTKEGEEGKYPIGGQVVSKGYDPDYGYNVVIKGLNPEEFNQLSYEDWSNPTKQAEEDAVRMSHLKELPMQNAGDYVATGSAGLKYGSTGKSTGSHVDIESFPVGYPNDFSKKRPFSFQYEDIKRLMGYR